MKNVRREEKLKIENQFGIVGRSTHVTEKNMQVFRARLERCISESDRLELFSVTPYICNQICGKIRHFGFVSNERAFHTLSFLQLKSTVQKLTSFQSCLRGKLQKQLTG